jgi:hypothetical protein
MKVNNYLYRVSADDFQKVPGNPIAYWFSKKMISLFEYPPLKSEVIFKEGLTTADNDQFLRFWTEVSSSKIQLPELPKKSYIWIPYNKGGPYRKWYGNNFYIINWSGDGALIKDFPGSSFRNPMYQLQEGGTFSAISSGNFGVRYSGHGFAFDSKGTMFFTKNISEAMIFLNCKICIEYLKVLAPTLDFRFGTVEKLPFLKTGKANQSFSILKEISKSDWDSYETSWDFTSLPLLGASYRGNTLSSTYENLRAHWNEMTLEMQRLEEENNRIFIEAYGLEDELTPDVPLKEITLTCNPYYRYGDSKSDSELEELLLADTMKELISYAVGCMFGRYSLDKPGLILANQGETYEDYCRLVPDSSFSADKDNAIPVLDGDWFSDDIVMRFRKFLRVTFGEERYEENLRFVEKALGKDLRQYFLRDFYNDHVRRYKKRPIYWMFSSPDGSFNVLIYMHRYRPDTASIVLNEYLREYQVKLSSYMDSLRRKEANPDLSKGEKIKALKELDKLRKTQDILATYEREVLFPLANQRIEIDLDDGVKVNYPKFGAALKKVPGLEAKE